MRIIITAFLALLFGVGFAAFFVANSVLGYLSDPDAFVDTARDAGTRKAIVDAIEADTLAKLAEDPRMGTVQQAAFRTLLERTITDEWLEESLRTTHAAAMAALEDASGNAVIDLTATKAALRRSVDDLADNAEESCSSLFGGTACGDRATSEELIAAFQRNLGGSIAEIPASLNLVELTTGDRTAQPQVEKKMKRLRSTLGTARTARLVALGVLGLCLLLIALVNASSLARVMKATGATLLVSVLLYVGVAYGYKSVASDRIDEAYRRSHADGGDRVELIALEASNRVAAAAVRNSAHRATWPVAGIGGIGLLLMLGGTLMPRRSR